MFRLLFRCSWDCSWPALFACAHTRRGGGRPNIIIIVSDDQGWGDVAYNGHPILRTPHLDGLARDGVRLDRFYAAAPVCSPTRGSILTGRHPSRYGVNWAYDGRLPAEEVTLAAILRDAGYRTGHFGKWHLGQLSRTLQQGSGGAHKPSPDRYAPPWDRGFDTAFSSAGRMPTHNPYHYPLDEGGRFPPRMILSHEDLSTDPSYRWPENYWTGSGCFVDEILEGDDSAIIMDRALAFMAEAASPFFACIWFHTPHTPVVAGPQWRERYAELSIEEQHWYGALEAMDYQIGRLLRVLAERSLGKDTLIWFCSDNGPSYVHPFGSAGPFSGRKGTLWEGGIRVPAIIHWPGVLPRGGVVDAPLSTSDMLPTVLALAGIPFQPPHVLDGGDVSPLLRGDQTRRAEPVFFHSPLRRADNPWADPDRFQAAVQIGAHKLLTVDAGARWKLFDLDRDPGETDDLAPLHSGLAEALKEAYLHWRASCEHSALGLDYAASWLD